MDKARVVSQITGYLNEELQELNKSGVESERARELKALLLMYRFLPRRDYGTEDVIVPSALVQLKLGSTVAYYYIAPQGGGLITRVDDQPLQVITPQSPLGEALLGKKVGDSVSVAIRGSVRQYEIVSIS